MKGEFWDVFLPEKTTELITLRKISDVFDFIV